MKKPKDTYNVLEHTVSQTYEVRHALVHLLDRLYSAMDNGCFHGGAFDSETIRRKCPKGEDVSASSRFICPKVLECQEHRCPMSFDMRLLWRTVAEAEKTIKKQPAHIIPFVADEVPTVENDREYVVSTEWFLREAIRVIGILVSTDNQVSAERNNLINAYVRLIQLGLSTIGYRDAAEEIGGINNESTDEPLSKQSHTVIAAAIKTARCFNRDQVLKAVKKAPRRAMRFFVLFLVSMMLEFSWNKKYSGADLSIYSEWFRGWIEIAYLFLKIAPDDIIAKMNFLNAPRKKGDIISWPRKNKGKRLS